MLGSCRGRWRCCWAFCPPVPSIGRQHLYHHQPPQMARLPTTHPCHHTPLIPPSPNAPHTTAQARHAAPGGLAAGGGRGGSRCRSQQQTKVCMFVQRSVVIVALPLLTSPTSLHRTHTSTQVVDACVSIPESLCCNMLLTATLPAPADPRVLEQMHKLYPFPPLPQPILHVPLTHAPPHIPRPSHTQQAPVLRRHWQRFRRCRSFQQQRQQHTHQGRAFDSFPPCHPHPSLHPPRHYEERFLLLL